MSVGWRFYRQGEIVVMVVPVPWFCNGNMVNAIFIGGHVDSLVFD